MTKTNCSFVIKYKVVYRYRKTILLFYILRIFFFRKEFIFDIFKALFITIALMALVVFHFTSSDGYNVDMIFIPSFIEICQLLLKLSEETERGHTNTDVTTL
jgi:hypothetical protein